MILKNAKMVFGLVMLVAGLLVVIPPTPAAAGSKVVASLLMVIQPTPAAASSRVDSIASMPSWQVYQEAKSASRESFEVAKAAVPVINAGLKNITDPIKVEKAVKATSLRGQHLLLRKGDLDRMQDALGKMADESKKGAASDVDGTVGDMEAGLARDAEEVEAASQAATMLEAVYVMYPAGVTEEQAYNIQSLRQQQAEYARVTQAEKAAIAEALKIKKFATGLDQRIQFMQRITAFKIRRNNILIALNSLQRTYFKYSIRFVVIFGKDCFREGRPDTPCILKKEAEEDEESSSFPDGSGSSLRDLHKRMSVNK